MIVVDASVAVKWFLPEVGSDHARALLTQDRRLIAPDVVRVEVLGAVARQFHKDLLSREQVLRASERWKRLLDDGELVLYPFEELTDAALALSIEARHAVMDCTYLALAKRYNAELLTADKPLHSRGTKVYANITLLPGIV